MSDRHDGGPAFPVPMIPADSHGAYTEVESRGMSLRDYFAVEATGDDIESWLPQTNDGRIQLCEELCVPKKEWAIRCWARYRHADAMLAERSKKA